MDEAEIFSVSEESEDGGVSYCWVEERDEGFMLVSNEEGDLSEKPSSTPVGAVLDPAFQFGMDYVDINTTLPAKDLRTILSSGTFVLENISTLTLNGQDVDASSVEAILSGYQS